MKETLLKYMKSNFALQLVIMQKKIAFFLPAQ